MSIEAIKQVAQSKPFVGVIGSVVGAGISAGVTYLVLSRRFETRLSEEIDKTKEYYKRQNKAGEFSDPTTLATELHGEEAVADTEDDIQQLADQENLVRVAADIMAKQEYTPYRQASAVEEEPTEELIISNVFEINEAQVAASLPHIISEEIFAESDAEHVYLDYYDVDGVMVGQDEELITNWEEFLGGSNLRFGEGTDDPNAVYVRNPNSGIDYEINRLDRSWTQENFGDVMHEPDEPPRKFKVYADD